LRQSNRAAAVASNASASQVCTVMVFVEIDQAADFFAARGTPTGKEVQEHGTALEIF